MSNLLLNPITYAVIAALLPVALLLFYIYRQDSAQPEPARWLWKGVWYAVYFGAMKITRTWDQSKSPIPLLTPYT